jgi:hypothetical protein
MREQRDHRVPESQHDSTTLSRFRYLLPLALPLLLPISPSGDNVSASCATREREREDNRIERRRNKNKEREKKKRRKKEVREDSEHLSPYSPSSILQGQRLRELRDPIGLVNRSVQQMNVVPDSQREEYLDSIAALHDTQPVTTNPIWLDLLAAPNTERRVETAFGSDQPQLHGTFRSDRSVFEEYHGMDNRK